MIARENLESQVHLREISEDSTKNAINFRKRQVVVFEVYACCNILICSINWS